MQKHRGPGCASSARESGRAVVFLDSEVVNEAVAEVIAGLEANLSSVFGNRAVVVATTTVVRAEDHVGHHSAVEVEAIATDPAFVDAVAVRVLQSAGDLDEAVVVFVAVETVDRDASPADIGPVREALLDAVVDHDGQVGVPVVGARGADPVGTGGTDGDVAVGGVGAPFCLVQEERCGFTIGLDRVDAGDEVGVAVAVRVGIGVRIRVSVSVRVGGVGDTTGGRRAAQEGQPEEGDEQPVGAGHGRPPWVKERSGGVFPEIGTTPTTINKPLFSTFVKVKASFLARCG